jgi:hypothetical protein
VLGEDALEDRLVWSPVCCVKRVSMSKVDRGEVKILEKITHRARNDEDDEAEGPVKKRIKQAK